jgi:hypothetical protein
MGRASGAGTPHSSAKRKSAIDRLARLRILARCIEDALPMSRAVRWGDAAHIEAMLDRGRKIRGSLN